MSEDEVSGDVTVRKAAPMLTTAWIVDGPEGARIQKSLRSTQIPEDPFAYTSSAGESGLMRPPYDLDQLSSALEGNSLHARCVKQKASDVLGRGVVLRGREQDGNTQPSAEEEDRWGAFLDQVEDDTRGDGSFKERLTWAHEDFESVGWATVEISRDATGLIDGLWHVPAHTIRAHADGRRYAQRRAGKIIWFKRFGVPGDVDRAKGGWSDAAIRDLDVRGNELLVIRNYTPRSDFYGLPDSMPALAAMAGWRAQHQFNVRFFDNFAVPSYAVIIEGAELTPDLEAKIMDHFQKIKGDPARTIIIPVPSVEGMDAASRPSVRFERLSVEVKEASFRLYKQDNALEICISHGVPPYRVGWPLMGSLGGATAEEMTAIYNDAIVQPRQETWEQRLDRTLLGKNGLAISQWALKCSELDVRNETRDLAKAKDLYLLGVTNPNDSARFFGYDARKDPGGSAYIGTPLAPAPSFGAAPAPEAIAKAQADAWMAEVRELAALRKRLEEIVSPGARAAA